MPHETLKIKKTYSEEIWLLHCVWRGKGIKSVSLEISLGGACQCLRDRALARSLPAVSVEREDGDPWYVRNHKSACNGQVGNRASPFRKVAGPIPQLRYVYTTACSTGNKLEELESTVQQENYDKFPTQKHGGMTCTTRVLQWKATNSSEAVGKEGEVVG